MRTVKRTIVAAVFVSKDGKVLFGKKDSHSGGVYLDCWHVPGGGVEPGETNANALKREMLEEVGIDISNCTTILLDDTDSGTAVKTDTSTGEKYLCEMHFHTYQVDLPARSDETRVILSDDLAEFQWVAKNDIFSMKLTPPSEKLFNKLGWNKQSE